MQNIATLLVIGIELLLKLLRRYDQKEYRKLLEKQSAKLEEFKEEYKEDPEKATKNFFGGTEEKEGDKEER